MSFRIKVSPAQIKAVETTCEAIIFRANGDIEDLGIISRGWWHKRLAKWLGLAEWRKLLKKKAKKSGIQNAMADVVTYAGFAIVTNTLVNLTLTPKYIGWGTGAGTSAQGNTSLFTEDYTTTNDGVHNIRVTGTLSQVTTSQTNDTFQIVGTLTAYGSQTITNCGTFDTNGQAVNLVTAPSGGNLYIKSDFTGIPLAANDAIQFTLKVKYS